MTKHAAEFRGDLKEFHEMTDKFYKKEINVAQYKGFSGRFGSYAQRGGNANMLRLRMTGGEINKEKLKFIADSIEKYDISLAHITTCQTLQLHNLSAEQVCTLIEEAFDHEIITMGGGGDFPRNVMCPPLSGVQKDEYFNVLPYAKEAADYLLGFINTVKLPRKLKVCFSNSKENITHATFRDLGFVAKENGTFDVYSAGGLGRNPRMGALVASDVEPCKILYYIKAMVETFIAHGNYDNRAAARTRFMQETLGTEGYVKAYQEKLTKILAEENLDLKIELPKTTKQANSNTLDNPRAIPQKQPGLYAVSYHPVGGSPKPEFFRKLYDAILPMEDVLVRLSPDEGMYIINLTSSEAEKILAITEDSANNTFESSVACIGASICQVGARDSQSLLHACVERVRKENFPDGTLPKIHISGCPSSCSAHQIAPLGFRGGVKQTPDGPKPAFAVFEQGCETQGNEAFGEDLGVMLESEIPEFLAELGKEISANSQTYEQFTAEHRDKFMQIVQKYTA
ncbi:MAG: nitrite/sulfite reductase [Lachnospiraceae bacterium]|nr:nitrite/sulfite reductase [Lachnospiraceae bacterium]